MELEKEFYELLTNNQHIGAVKAPWDENVFITPKDLETYYRYECLNDAATEPYS